MATIRSFGALQRGWATASPPAALRLGSVTSLGALSYASIYRHQPEVRVVVEFLARNIAQLGLHLFKLEGETDRKRDRSHGSIRLLERPNPYTTRYRLIEGTVQDMAIYGHAFWLKVRQAGGSIQYLVRVPPDRMAVGGDLAPVSYRYRGPDGHEVHVSPLEVIHFRTYDPIDELRGVSPLESLKGIVAESRAAATSRTAFWRNGAKLGGYIQRPLEAKPWSVDARERFRVQFREKYAGATNAGGYPVLEEGMSFHPVVSTMVDAEAIATWKLTREEVARAYHIPLPMVGILDHATFSNITAQHKHLYQDCLGPWLTMLVEELDLQFMPEFAGSSSRYLEFNIQEKLAGSFEEQSAALQTSVGGAWMTRNEARSRMNLPRDEDPGADRILTALNMSAQPAGAAIPETTTEAMPA